MNTVTYVDGSPYINQTIRYNKGTMPCFSPGKMVYTDTWVTCAAYQFPFVLEMIGFGYITGFLCAVIIALSLFGGIKENYKWFILNQAIWDLFVSYDIICNKPSYIYYYNFKDFEFAKKHWNQFPPTCFYSYNGKDIYSWQNYIEQTIDNTLENIQFSLTFALAFSRFLSMYFPIFYQKHSSNRKIVLILIIYNLITLFLLNYYQNVSYFVDFQMTKECPRGPGIPINSACEYKFLNQTWRFVLQVISVFSQALWFLFASVMTFIVLFKILMHTKFQYKDRQKSLASYIRIIVALLFSSLFSLVYFVFMFIIKILTSLIHSYLMQTGVDLSIQNWFTFATFPTYIGVLNNTRQSVNNLRIFIECILALTLLTGYRNGIIKIFKSVGYFVMHPKKGFKAVKSKVPGNSVSSIVFAENWR